ncbi:MAG: 23S rRNA (adenine(2503)-C(2))-methyltransferase RlmN [Chlamydiae bacterium]|nr:23S rRNA (adenine(2503)-C(2))-methyltransferase RlmN [Chlamydiota bacterium]
MHIHSLSLQQLKEWLVENGEKPFRATQIFEWVYNKPISSWDEMSNIAIGLRQKIADHFKLSCLDLVKTEESSDGQTIKFLWRLADEKLVESVLILAPGRQTVCVSSQVGCPARCAFCASGKEGLIRSLSAEEIFNQVYLIHKFLVQKGQRVSNVVFMGMGEPLDNYDEVVKSIKLLCDTTRLHIAERKITVSTVGIIEGIKRLANEDMQVNLVLSLHAPNQHIRKKIIPFARKYELSDILDSMLDYSKKTGRDITYEYTLLKDINDQAEHAEELALLVKTHPCTVNLIPYNPVDGLHLQRPEKESIENFRSILESKGIVVTWRYTKGKDIAAACGQLALKTSKEHPLALAKTN